ncbi:MAG: class I SAM-dependent methyltransferase [Planctomycetes bacterium]|nr:class I SAM-dependent methyltransferase [Planctomycetota bacterium]
MSSKGLQHRRRSARTARPPQRGAGALQEREALKLLDAALDRRANLLNDPHTTVARVCHGAADGLPGLVIERLGEILVAQLHEQRLQLSVALARRVCAAAQERLQVRAVYVKNYFRDRGGAAPEPTAQHRDPVPWLGERVEPELAVLENGVRFLVRPYDGFSTGLFLEHRENRARVRRLAAGSRVLNAFAYTCGFSVAAALAGAARTVSVDVSRRYLEWGQRNFAANEIELAGHTFICSDIFDYYKRARRQGRGFDLIILDPPTFARVRRPKRVFVLSADLDRLLAGALSLLEPAGHLLLATNHRGTTRRRLEQAVAAAAGRRAWQVIARPRLPQDFRGDPDFAKSILIRVD